MGKVASLILFFVVFAISAWLFFTIAAWLYDFIEHIIKDNKKK